MSAFGLSESELAELRGAWRELRIEWTRTLFGIASAGVGLSTGAIFAADAPLSLCVGALLIFAAVVFGALALLCLVVHERSADLILYIVRNKMKITKTVNRELRRMQQWQKGLVTAGVAAVCVAAFAHTYQGAKMSDHDKTVHASSHNFSEMLALYNRQTPAPPAAKPTDAPQSDSPQSPELNEREEKN